MSDMEELKALVQWICTFTNMSNVTEVYPLSMDVDESLVHKWLSKKGVAFGILQIAAELTSNQTKMNDDDDDDDISDNGEPIIDASIRKASYFASEEDIWNKTCDLIQLPPHVEDKHLILSTLLRMAVADECNKRDTYISRILQIDQPDVQRILMIIIERNLKQNSPSPKKKSEEQISNTPPLPTKSGFACFAMDFWNDNVVESKTKESFSDDEIDYDDESATSSEYTGYDSARTDQTDELGKNRKLDNMLQDKSYDSNVSISPKKKRRKDTKNFRESLLDQVQKLQNEKKSLEEIVEKNKIQEDERAEQESKRRANDLKKEAAFIDKENSLRNEYEAKIKQLEEMADLSKTHEQNWKLATEQISELKDEIDILRHGNQKLSVTEDQLQKCKERLAAIGNVQEALKEEEEAHGRAVDRCLDLENKLNHLQPLQRQVENYRNRATEAEVKAAEYQEKLNKAQSQNESLIESNKKLQEVSNYQLKEQENIKQQLINEVNVDVSVGSGLGDGISELNPILKEELLRLRNENEQLKLYKTRTSQETFVDLEDKLEDSSRLADTFKKRFLETKATLEETKVLLEQSTCREENLRKEIIVLDEKMEELKQKCEDERERAIAKEKEDQDTFQNTIISLTQKAKSEFETMVKEMSNKIENTKKDANERENNLLKKMENQEVDLRNKNDDLRKDYEHQLDSLKKSGVKEREDIVNNHNAMVKKMKEDFEKDRIALVEKGTEMYKKKKEIYVGKIMKYNKNLEKNIAEFQSFKKKSQKEKEELHNITTTQINTIKNQNHSLLEHQRELEQEIEDLESQKKKLERDKIIIREENERFRRYVGSRIGSEKNWESQFDALQREYNQIFLENKELKQRWISNISKTSDYDGSTEEDKENQINKNNNNVKVSDSIWMRMREEYSSKLNKMNDEKRELVMRNSAAISDLQKANQRSWQLEDELSKIKSELTSTKLTLQRFEHSQRIEQLDISNGKPFFVDKGSGDLASIAIASSTVSMMSKSKSVAHVRSGSDLEKSLSNDDSNCETLILSHDDTSMFSQSSNTTSHYSKKLPRTTLSTKRKSVIESNPVPTFKSILSPSNLENSKRKSLKKVSSIESQTQIDDALDGRPECAQS